MLYINPNGNDDISRENNSSSSPWKTPNKAWASAIAGDSVFFDNGTYFINVPINTKYSGSSGTADNKIIFRNNPNSDNVIFSTNLDEAVFVIEKPFNEVSGINFIGGKTWFKIGLNLNAEHFSISNCSAILSNGGDNTGFVYANPNAKGLSIKNCSIKGPGTGSTIHHNTSGLILFNVDSTVIMNCEIFNVPRGIYYKHGNILPSNASIEISYNFIHNSTMPMLLNTINAKVHDNIIGENCSSVVINSGNGGASGDYNVISNNTFYNHILMLLPDDGGALYNTLKYNVFTKNTYIHAYSSLPHYTTTNNNIYPDSNIVLENGIKYTFTNWIEKNKTDSINCTNPSICNPNPFKNNNISRSKPSDFQLIDSLQVYGANISMVGVDSTIAIQNQSNSFKLIIDGIKINK